LDIKERITVAYTGPYQNVVKSYQNYIQQTCYVVFGAAIGLTIGDLTFDCGQVDANSVADKRKKLEQDQAQCQKLLENERFKAEKPDVYAEKVDLSELLLRQLAIIQLIEGRFF
jgi:hypothetical protein